MKFDLSLDTLYFYRIITEWVIKSFDCDRIFQKKQNMGLRNLLDEKVFFLHVVIVLTCFQPEKSQNKLNLMQSVLLKRFTKLAKINLTGSKA